MLNRTFKDLDKAAKAAGASQEEFQTIMSRQWAENALLNFDKLGDDPFKESNLTKNTAGITVPINLNPVLNNGKYEKVISDLGSELETLIIPFTMLYHLLVNL